MHPYMCMCVVGQREPVGEGKYDRVNMYALCVCFSAFFKGREEINDITRSYRYCED